MGGNWLKSEKYRLNDLAGKTTKVRLSETVANNDGTNHVRIDLPEKRIAEQLPYEGEYQYYSGKGDDLHHAMSVKLTLPEASNIALTFDTFYAVEPDYDFARVLVNGKAIPGNITTMNDPHGMGLVPAVSSFSVDHPENVDGWVPAVYNLTAFAGQDVVLTLEYITDGGWIEQGFYADNIAVVADGEVILADDAESEQSKFDLAGYVKNDAMPNTTTTTCCNGAAMQVLTKALNTLSALVMTGHLSQA
ncbi:M6 family metallopeptidase [Veronia nyctiphanis]|uniref:hypothetical protein n=1 Tax=Veronia nyctiphanis TaxID=1278244 RepID=UPI0038B5AC43